MCDFLFLHDAITKNALSIMKFFQSSKVPALGIVNPSERNEPQFRGRTRALK